MKPSNLQHVFEAAGLGLAPFRFVGVVEKVYVAGDEAKPGGVCAYCGTGIRYCCIVKSSDGKQFLVGSDCVEKTNDKGLVKSVKLSPEFLEHQRQLRKARAEKKYAEARELIATHYEWLAKMSHPHSFVNRETGAPLTFLDYCEWMMENSGDKGKSTVVSAIKYKLKQLIPVE